MHRLAVAGDRELTFFPGLAQGAVHPGFRYETEHGAASCRLLFRSDAVQASPYGPI